MRCRLPIFLNSRDNDGNLNFDTTPAYSTNKGSHMGHHHPWHGNAHVHHSRLQSHRVIYDSETDIEIVKCFCPGCIAELHDEMMNVHPFLFHKENRIPVLEDFAKNKAVNIGPFILELLKDEDTRKKVHAKLSMPTFVGFRVLDCMGLPDEGDVIFSSTATANSANDDAVTTALDIMGFTDPKRNITFYRSSTASSEDGRTMFTHKVPKNPAVYFDPYAKLDDFADCVARPLASQFFSMTLHHNNIQEKKPTMRVLPTYNKMYHYSCISQSKTTDVFGMPVTNWGIHEQWNLLAGSAMMHHVALTLKPGGNALVKVRVFKRAETLGLLALLSSLFEQMQIVDITDQTTSYAAALFFNMTDDVEKRQKVADTIWNAMDQDPISIYFNDVMQGDTKVKENLALCIKHRRIMMDYRSTVDTLFMDCLQSLVYQIENWKPADTFPLKDELEKHYGGKMGEYFWDRWVGVHKTLLNNKNLTKRETLLWVMHNRWSRPSHEYK
jgi:flagellar hook-basal body complex protein FliE